MISELISDLSIFLPFQIRIVDIILAHFCMHCRSLQVIPCFGSYIVSEFKIHGYKVIALYFPVPQLIVHICSTLYIVPGIERYHAKLVWETWWLSG